jgi:hypothetical protein
MLNHFLCIIWQIYKPLLYSRGIPIKSCAIAIIANSTSNVTFTSLFLRFLSLKLSPPRCLALLDPEGKIATLMNDTYNAHVSVGTVVDYLKKAAELFGDEYKRIKREMRESPICNYDDTGQRVDRKNHGLWAFVSKEAVLYLTSKNRGKKVVIKIRENVERKHPPPESLEFYEGLLRIFEHAKEVVARLETEEERSRVYAEFVDKLENFVTREGKWDHHAVKKLAKWALKYRHELFTFILVPGVDPTNNVAEHALRPGVRQRKIWGAS